MEGKVIYRSWTHLISFGLCRSKNLVGGNPDLIGSHDTGLPMQQVFHTTSEVRFELTDARFLSNKIRARTYYQVY